MFSIGEVHPQLDVTAIAYDKDTRQTVPDCLLAFEQSLTRDASYVGTYGPRTGVESSPLPAAAS